MTMKFNVTGAQRKALVTAMAQELNTQAVYCQAPTFAYQVGDYHIDKNGTVTGPTNQGLVYRLASNHGLEPATEVEYETPAFEELPLTMEEELGLGIQRRDHLGEDGPQPDDVPEQEVFDSDNESQLTIEVPLDGFTPEKLDNLTKMVTAKETLFKAALGVEELPIQLTENTIRFPWFCGEDALTPEESNAYSTFVSLLCETAKEKKRVTAKAGELPSNPKFAMRVFLISLGMVGDEYKVARKVLLSRLEGNSAFRDGMRKSPSPSTPEGATIAEAQADAAIAEAQADAELIHEVNMAFENGEAQ